MKRPLTRAVLALSLALVLTPAACGGDDANQFREDYNAAVDKLSKINADIGQAAGGATEQSNDEIAKEFDQIADTAEQTRTDLADLDPPEDAKDEFDKLLTALDSGVEDLRAVAGAAKTSNPRKYARATQDLVKSGAAISEAEDALKKAVDG